MNIKKILILFTFLSLLFVNGYSQTLSFQVSDNEIEIGEETSIEINVENVSNLKGYSLVINYKSNVADCFNILRGDFLSSAAQTIFLSDIDSLSQEIIIEEVILTNASKSGSGKLASFKLRGLNDGIVNLTFSKKDLRDPENQEIPVTVGVSTIVVGDTSSLNDERLVLTPRLSEIKVGDTVLLHLQIENVEDLNKYSASIIYDAEYLDPFEVIEEDFLSSSGSTTFEYSINSSEEQINISGSLEDGVGSTGTGYLATIKLKAIKAGSTALVFSGGNARDNTGNPIENMELLNAVINISSIINLTDSLKIKPVSRILDQNDTTEVFIEIANVESMRSYSIYLNYDPTIIEAMKVERADFLAGEDLTFFFSRIDSISGIIRIDESILGDGERDGTGNLFKIKFFGKNPGTSNIEFDSVYVMNNQDEDIELDLVNSSIDVQEIVSTVLDESENMDFHISQNYPNPFNAGTTIKYYLPTDNDVDINIYNIVGQKVIEATISNARAGEHSFYWNGSDFQNQECSSGIYLFTVSNGSFNKSIKLLLLK